MKPARFALPLVLLFCGWQSVPTNSIHITGEPGTVQISISDEQPDGTVTQIEWRERRLPVRFYVNADHHLRLKIESETPVEARRFYESQGGKELLTTLRGTRIEFDIPARN